MTTMSLTMPDRSSRLLLVVSLALNLFFLGTIGALAIRHYVTPAQPAATERTRTAAARIERLAAPLPAADAEKLRAAFRAQEAAAERTRDALNQALARLQRALRTQPFDAAELRAALTDIRTA
ncbi:MAG: Heavy-metal resistance, partial [Hyphomicrobiales bacterium]|nr:Heavy-metal resistance [Hyphomicrobiales bacterium]